MAEQPIEPGQVWANRGRYGQRRTVRVDSVDSRYAYCTVLTPRAPNGRTGHTTRVEQHGLRTRYRLVTLGGDRD